LLALGLLLGATGTASACGMRQAFFRDTEEGSVAHLPDVRTGLEAQSLYQNWCSVSNHSFIRTERQKVYFAINDRSDDGGKPHYYILKIFRRSRDTELNPLLYLRRSGPWVNRRCDGATGDLFEYTAKGQQALAAFFGQLNDSPPLARNRCTPAQRWLAWAHGRSDLWLGEELPFLKTLPRRVSDTGVYRWSVNFLAAAYLTKPLAQRNPRNTVFMVSRDGADEIYVQVSSGSRTWTFGIQG
jgi:hypothetical protein